MPTIEATGNWYTYLSEYEEFRSGLVLRDRRKALEAMPLVEAGISKNDGHLENFLWRTDDTLIGIDFAEARRKPLGWDILLTARSLRRTFGGAAKPVINGLVEGWCAARPGSDKQATGKLVRLFLRALDMQSKGNIDPS